MTVIGTKSIVPQRSGLWTAMTMFCWCMNILAQTTFDELDSDLHNAYVQTAQKNQCNGQKLQNCLQ